MKSHVRENIYKSIVSSWFNIKRNPNGENDVEFTSYGKEAIEEILKKGVQISDWKLSNNGEWSVFVNTLDKRISGSSIIEVLAKTNMEYEKISRKDLTND